MIHEPSPHQVEFKSEISSDLNSTCHQVEFKSEISSDLNSTWSSSTHFWAHGRRTGLRLQLYLAEVATEMFPPPTSPEPRHGGGDGPQGSWIIYFCSRRSLYIFVFLFFLIIAIFQYGPVWAHNSLARCMLSLTVGWAASACSTGKGATSAGVDKTGDGTVGGPSSTVDWEASDRTEKDT